MIIVKVMGGLGNQLFQYALYRQLQENGKEAYLDISWYRGSNSTYRKFQLNLFQTKIKECTKRQKYKLAGNDESLAGIVCRKIFGRKKSYVIESETGEFDPDILKMQDVYLDGYWQRKEYFEDISELLRNELVLRKFPVGENKRILEEIEKTNSVAIHVRRGDYLKMQDMFGGICTEEYYNNSMKYMGEHINDAHFFVFSDDMGWCRKFFDQKENITFVDINNEDASCFDLFLMSKCKNMIMANSSFSWWAEYLNNNADKVVVAPSKWINNNNGSPVCENCIKIGG